MQVLIGIVVVHIKWDVEVHSAQGVHQLADGLPLHHHIEVGVDAGQAAHLLLQGSHAVLHPLGLRQVGGAPVAVVHHVDPLQRTALGAGVDHSVPWQADGVQALVVGVERKEEDGVRQAAGHVPPHHQEGVVALLPSALGHIGQLCPRELDVLSLPGLLGGVRAGRRRVRHLGHPYPGAHHRPDRDDGDGQDHRRLEQAVPDALSPGHPGDPLPALLPPLLKLLSQGAPLPMLLSASSVLSAHLLVPLVIPLFLSRALSASPGPGGYWCG